MSQVLFAGYRAYTDGGATVDRVQTDEAAATTRQLIKMSMQVQSVNRPEFLYAAPTAPNLARERQRGS